MNSTVKIEVYRVKLQGRDRIAVKFRYNQSLIRQVRSIPGARWSTHGKYWHVADTTANINRLDRIAGKPLNNLRPGISLEVLAKIELMKKWMAQKRYSATTIKSYTGYMKIFFTENPTIKWNQLTVASIEQFNYTYFIENKLSFSAQNQWINAIKTYIKVHGINDLNILDIERPRKEKVLPNVLSPVEIKRLLACTANMKHQTLLMLIYACGLRIGEALRLQLEDIRTKEGLIYIRQSKGKKDRRVPLSERLLLQLRDYYKAYKPEIYLFEGTTAGIAYSSRSAAQIFQRSAAKAGIKRKVTLHTLRHSYATHLTLRGVNVQYLQEILGHNSPKTTMLYTHLSGKDIKDIRSPLDDLNI